MWPPCPKTTAYKGTKGCGAPNEKRVSGSGWGKIRILTKFGSEDAHRTKKKENNSNQSTNSTDNGTPKDTSSRSDWSLLCFFGDMTRGIEANQNSGSSEVRKAPVPCRGSACTIIRCHESVVSRTKAPSITSANWQPNKVQEEIK